MHMTCLLRHPTLLAPTLAAAAALTLAACDTDGDLGKDSQGSSDSADSGDSAASGDSGDSGSDSDSGANSAGSDSAGSDTAGDTSGDSCTDEQCGPAPGADPMCPDGSSAEWTCVAMDGTCGWQSDCPGVEPCTDAECGPAPGAPNELCPDGVNFSGPGPCERNTDGVCGWTWAECPPCCEPAEAPGCDDIVTCCGDGTWVCGDESGCPDGEAGLECQGGEMCSDEGQSCADGQTCCDGTTCCAGVPVEPGQEFCGSICPMSDRNKKENFAMVDADAILQKVSALEISTWNYTFQDPKYRHLGPMAQDFMASFEIGHTDKAIFQVDADGVALASIQALNTHVQKLESENAQLKKTLAAMEKRLEKLEAK